MTELGASLNPEAPTNLPLTRALLEQDLALLVTQYEERRTLLRARLAKLEAEGFATPGPAPRPEVTPPTPEELAPLPQVPRPAARALAAAATPASGTRLRATWLEGDGARAFGGFTDATRGERCDFARLADGTVRCLPPFSEVARLTYADAACATPVLRTQAASCDPPALVLLRTGDAACAQRLAFYRRGARIEATPAALYERSAAGACIPATTAITAADAFYALAEVPASSFVAATVQAGDGARVVPELALAEDGARDLVGFRDGALAGPCRFGAAADGSVRCLPLDAPEPASLFADDQCSRAIFYELATCARRGFLSRPDPTRCTERTTIFRAGERAAQVFQQSGGRCAPLTSFPATLLATPVGEEVPPASLAPEVLVTLPGPGRLRAMGRAVDELVAGTPGLFHDEKLGLTCRAAVAADGVRRCLPPPDAIVAPVFADLGCTIPLAARVPGCAPPALAAGRVGATCPARTAIYRVGGPHRGPVYARDTAGRCGMQTFPATASIYEVGPELPAADFVELKAVER
jgi:hypothetical protein